MNDHDSGTGAPDDGDPRKEYVDFRRKYGRTAVEDLKSGAWFIKLVQWILQTHARQVDAEYLRKKYPGAGPAHHAQKAIKLTSRYAALLGGTSAAAITALELSVPATAGLDLVVAIPAMTLAVLADVSLVTRAQLRAVYDLSAIHGAPLDMDDAEDCYLVFAAAMGIKLAEGAGEFAKAIGPKVAAYNVRRMLRSGFREGLIAIVKKIGGTELAKKITEKALMRLLVPGISIPISATASYWFTNSILKTADKRMIRRSAVIQPVVQLYRKAPELPRETAVKALIAVLEAPKRPDGWEEGQLDALRHTQSALHLDDRALKQLDGWFDRTPEDVIGDLQALPPAAGGALIEYLVTAAALGSQPEHDVAYGTAIQKLADSTGACFDMGAIATVRKRLPS